MNRSRNREIRILLLEQSAKREEIELEIGLEKRQVSSALSELQRLGHIEISKTERGLRNSERKFGPKRLNIYQLTKQGLAKVRKEIKCQKI